MKKGPFKMKGMTFKESPAKISETELLKAAKDEGLARTSAKVQKGMADSRKTRLFGLQAALAGVESAIPGLDKLKKKKPKEEKEKVDTDKLEAEKVKTYDMYEKQIEERPIVTEDPNPSTGELTLKPMQTATYMRKQDTVFPMKYGRRKKKK